MKATGLTPKREKFAQAFYVYELVDPRCGSVFYVGKGQGNRLTHHAKAARAGRVDNVEKFRRIRQIHAAGFEVVERIVSRHDSEREAFAAERVAIEMMREGLTNIVGGSRTNADIVAERAQLELDRTLPLDVWERTITPKQRKAVEGCAGSLRAYHEDRVQFLRGLGAR